MHKTEAANLFKVLSDENIVKIIKKLYMNKLLSYKQLIEITELDNKILDADLTVLLDAKLIIKDNDNYLPNTELIDELMNFIKTPCQCQSKKTKFTVKAFGLDFVFEKHETDCAWYDFDHMTSTNGQAQLRIDADRDVYGLFKENSDSEEIQGTIRDDDDNILADNYGVDDGYSYHFVKSEKQGYYD